MKKQNLFDLSLLSSLGIILVVIGHSLPSRFSYDNNLFLNEVISWIYTFHMPLFFYISGYLWIRFKKEFFFTDLKAKSLRLLVPYLFFSIPAFFIKALLNEFATRKVDISFEDFFISIFFPWENPVIFYWFLPTLFVVTILGSLLFRSVDYLSKKLVGDTDNAEKIIILLNNSFILFLFLINVFVVLKFDLNYKSEGLDFLNVTGVIYHLPFFLIGVLFSSLSRCYILPVVLLLSAISLWVFGIFFDYNSISIAFIWIFIIHFISMLVLSINDKGFLSPLFCNIVLLVHNSSFFIYLTSFYFQVVFGFLVYNITDSAALMFCSQLVSGLGLTLITRFILIRNTFFNRLINKYGL